MGAAGKEVGGHHHPGVGRGTERENTQRSLRNSSSAASRVGCFWSKKRKESTLNDYCFPRGFSPLINPRWWRDMSSTWPWKISSVTTGLDDLDVFLLNKMPWRTCLCCVGCPPAGAYWHNREELAYEAYLACLCLCVCVRVGRGGAGIAETTSANVPLLSRNDLPGHVTAGSHRDAG